MEMKTVSQKTETPSFFPVTSTFTYTYDPQSYPTKVGIVQATVDEVHGNSQLNLGTYQFSYY
jgi:hypothetical protein